MRKDLVIPAVAAFVTLAVHLVGNAHYGFFRDELYFIMCGRRPAWGYVDQPPVVPLLAAASQLFGHSLFLLRAVPALFAAAGVFATCLLAAALGGGRFAQAFAGLVFLCTTVLTAFGQKAGPDEVGLFTWPLIALLVLRIAKGGDPRLWLAVGVAIGVSLQSKYSAIFFLTALLAGVLATPTRRILRDRFFALGCLVAAIIVLPNFLWQWHESFPMWELLRNGQDGKNVIASPLVFLAQQLLITTVFVSPVWIVGVMWLLRKPAFRFLGIAYVVLIAEMIVLHGKHYYPADFYPIVIAAGAIPFEAWTARRRALRFGLVAYTAMAGIAFAPIVLPILPETTYVAYAAGLRTTLHLPKDALATEHGRESSALPGDWADMHGWPELAATVARVYDALPAATRAQTVVFANDYGTAAAIEFFTPSIPVIGAHNQYWLWGMRGHTARVLLQVGGTCFHADHLYERRTVETTFSSRWGIASEQNLPIATCTGLRRSFASIWPEAKAYI